MPAPRLGRCTPRQLLHEAPRFAPSGCWWRRAVVGLGWSWGRSPGEGTVPLPHHSRGTAAGETPGLSWAPWPPLCTRRPTHRCGRTPSQMGAPVAGVHTRTQTRTPRRGWLHTQAPPHRPVAHRYVCGCRRMLPHTKTSPCVTCAVAHKLGSTDCELPRAPPPPHRGSHVGLLGPRLLRAFLRDTAVEGLRAEPSVRELTLHGVTRARGPQQGPVTAVRRRAILMAGQSERGPGPGGGRGTWGVDQTQSRNTRPSSWDLQLQAKGSPAGDLSMWGAGSGPQGSPREGEAGIGPAILRDGRISGGQLRECSGRGSRTDRTRVVLLTFLLRAGSERGRGIRPPGLNRGGGCEGQVSFLTHQLCDLGQVT